MNQLNKIKLNKRLNSKKLMMNNIMINYSLNKLIMINSCLKIMKNMKQKYKINKKNFQRYQRKVDFKKKLMIL